MSTIKSSSEHLTLNADGASKDIKFQSNGVEKASLSDAGLLTTSGGASLDGAVTINDSGADVDFRVESDTDTHALFVQGSDGAVGINHNSPTAPLTVQARGSGTSQPILYLRQGGSSPSHGYIFGVDNSSTGKSYFRRVGYGDVEGINLVTYSPTGDVTVNAGNLKFGTSGKGIDFSATSDSGGMTSEVLDDYEEGTWTPAITMGSGTATLTATTGRYTKIGRMVTASIDAHVASVSTPSGSCTVNLPFTTNSVVRECVVFHTYGHTIPTGESHTIAQTLDSQSNLNLLYGGGTTTPSFVPSAGTYFTLTLTYEAA